VLWWRFGGDGYGGTALIFIFGGDEEVGWLLNLALEGMYPEVGEGFHC